MPETMTIPEFAALCREKCTAPSQGHEDSGLTCGATYQHPDDGEVFTFCGRHWGIALGSE